MNSGLYSPLFQVCSPDAQGFPTCFVPKRFSRGDRVVRTMVCLCAHEKDRQTGKEEERKNREPVPDPQTAALPPGLSSVPKTKYEPLWYIG